MRHLFFLKLFFLLVIPAICNMQPSQTLLQTQQFFFIPNSSYLQFRVSLAEMGRFALSTSISKISANMTFQIANNNTKNILFNMIVLPPLVPSIDNYYFYNCYMRAAFEGFDKIGCSISNSTAINGNCTSCVSNAINSSTYSACLGCSQSFFAQIQQDLNDNDNQNHTANKNIVFIIDNTNIISPTGKYLEMEISYKVNIFINSDNETVVLFFLIMLIVIIVIALIMAVYLTIKIRKINSIINNYDLKYQ